jgi:hypothetical protein
LTELVQTVLHWLHVIVRFFNDGIGEGQRGETTAVVGNRGTVCCFILFVLQQFLFVHAKGKEGNGAEADKE